MGGLAWKDQVQPKALLCTTSTSKPPWRISLGSTTGYRKPRTPCVLRTTSAAPGAMCLPRCIDDARLLLGGHAHERRQEDDVIGGQFPGDMGDIGGAKRHARGERDVGARGRWHPRRCRSCRRRQWGGGARRARGSLVGAGQSRQR
jgi:hypothetical protein